MFLQPGMKGAVWLFGYGTLAALFGSVVLVDQYRFEHSAERADARVVEHRTGTVLDKWKHPHHQPIDVYAYTTTAGALVRFEETHGAHTPIGSTAVVFYRSDAPERARLQGMFSLLGWGPLVVAGICFGLAFLHLRSSRLQVRVPSPKNRQKAERRRNRARTTRRSAR